MEFVYLVFTPMPFYRSLLMCLCDAFRALINSLVYWLCTSALGLVLFQICDLWLRDVGIVLYVCLLVTMSVRPEVSPFD